MTLSLFLNSTRRLCDVAMPYSSRNPQFNRELLKKAVKSHNIDVFLGEELGARPKTRHATSTGDLSENLRLKLV